MLKTKKKMTNNDICRFMNEICGDQRIFIHRVYPIYVYYVYIRKRYGIYEYVSVMTVASKAEDVPFKGSCILRGERAKWKMYIH